MSATVAGRRPVGLDELRRAWAAIEAGQFRAGHGSASPRGGGGAAPARPWRRTEPVLPVLGCVGQAGASTLALAIATVAGRARVLECCSATASGLAAAATAELGTTAAGWALARREEVALARAGGVLAGVGEVPAPPDPAAPVELTVLDVGWVLGQVMAAGGWVADTVNDARTVVAVTTATVPGLRRGENALTLLGSDRVVLAVVGPARRRWPRPLAGAVGPQAATVERAGRMVCVPVHGRLAIHGLDTTALPRSVLAAAATILGRAGLGTPPSEGHPS